MRNMIQRLYKIHFLSFLRFVIKLYHYPSHSLFQALSYTTTCNFKCREYIRKSYSYFQIHVYLQRHVYYCLVYGFDCKIIARQEAHCRETGHILIKREEGCEVWWLIPVIPAMKRLWQEGLQFYFRPGEDLYKKKTKEVSRACLTNKVAKKNTFCNNYMKLQFLTIMLGNNQR